MTTAGRIALWANVAFSLLFAMWGFTVWSNRVDFTDMKSAERKGEFAKRSERVKELIAVRENAIKPYVDAAQAHAALERRIPELEKFYAARLESLRTGADKAPVQGLAIVKGELQYDANGFPRLAPATNAQGRPIAGLLNQKQQEEEYLSKQAQINALEKEILRIIEEEKKVTQAIGNGTSPGVRLELAKIQDRERRSQLEQEYLKPLLYNAQEDAKLLVARRKELEARLEQLKKASVAQAP